jgi:hypothetical protein
MSREAGAKNDRYLRDAIASGEFPKALRLWDEYAGDLRCAIQNRTATEADMAEMRELVEWSRVVVECARAHSLQRLAGCRKVETVAAAYNRAVTDRV